jgi:hypothetical protein
MRPLYAAIFNHPPDQFVFDPQADQPQGEGHRKRIVTGADNHPVTVGANAPG